MRKRKREGLRERIYCHAHRLRQTKTTSHGTTTTFHYLRPLPHISYYYDSLASRAAVLQFGGRILSQQYSSLKLQSGSSLRLIDTLRLDISLSLPSNASATVIQTMQTDKFPDRRLGWPLLSKFEHTLHDPGIAAALIPRAIVCQAPPCYTPPHSPPSSSNLPTHALSRHNTCTHGMITLARTRLNWIPSRFIHTSCSSLFTCERY